MDSATTQRTARVEFWDSNARWYDLWIRHNSYHEKIIGILTDMVRPGWRVLDIGGGGGVLSLPLAREGCRVTVIEPSSGMRDLLHNEVRNGDALNRITVDRRTWEETQRPDFLDFDLIIACNSLHLMGIGFEEALDRVFLAQPKRAFVVTEEPLQAMSGKAPPENYDLVLSSSFEAESSYVYHSIDEAYEHWAFRVGRPPNHREKTDLQTNLIFCHGHFRLMDKATVHIYCWNRKEA